MRDNGDDDDGNIGSCMTPGFLIMRSLVPKGDKNFELIEDRLDIFVITELWHGPFDDISIRLAMPLGYCFVDCITL